MMKQYLLAGGILVLILAVAGGFLSMIYGTDPRLRETVPTAPTEVPTRASFEQVIFRVPDPDAAPAPLHELVVEGYYVLLDTPMHASEFVKKQSQLSCRNCHFDAGRERQTISLVGAAAQYPKAVPGPQGVALATLEQKVQQCFVANIGGSPPPAESRTMQATIAYLQWISAGLPLQRPLPWLGLSPLTAPAEPNPDRGRQIYASVCSRCHGPNGQGGGLAPALWGDDSFTTESSMARPPMLASFVQQFMPFRKPTLEVQQAGDTAAFVLSQPRWQPHAKVPPPPAAKPATPEAQSRPSVPPAMPYGLPAELFPSAELENAAQQILKGGTAEMPAAQPSKEPAKSSAGSK